MVVIQHQFFQPDKAPDLRGHMDKTVARCIERTEVYERPHLHRERAKISTRDSMCRRGCPSERGSLDAP